MVLFMKSVVGVPCMKRSDCDLWWNHGVEQEVVVVRKRSEVAVQTCCTCLSCVLLPCAFSNR